MDRVLLSQVDNFSLIIDQLKKNQVVAMATETVYGLAALSNSILGIQGIFEIKKRPLTNPLIVHLKKSWIELSLLDQKGIIDSDKLDSNQVQSYNLLMQHWPAGPLSILLPRGKFIDPMITAQGEWVAIRRPLNCFMADLLEKLDTPIVAPSANPYQKISPVDAQMVENYYPNDNFLIVDSGRCTYGLESTVIRLLPTSQAIQIIRPGSITKEMIEDKTGLQVLTSSQDQESKKGSPGQDLLHYAPNNKTLLLDHSLFFTIDQLKIIEKKEKKISILCFSLNDEVRDYLKKENIPYYELGTNPIIAAHHFYRALYDLDKNKDQLIILSRPPILNDEFLAINDKLERACFNQKGT